MSKLLYRGPNLTDLHEHYAKQGRTDDLAPVSAESSVLIDAPPERVWQVISDVAGWPSVDPALSQISVSEGVVVDGGFTWTNGKSRIKSRFAVVDPSRELTWTGVSSGAKAIHRNVLQPDSHGTRLVSEESMAGPLLTLFYDSDKLATGLHAWVEAIKVASERRT